MKKFIVGSGRFEVLDPTPVAIPIGYSQPETFEQTLERLVSRRVDAVLGRTPDDYDNDDDNDFELDDDNDGFLYNDDFEYLENENKKDSCDSTSVPPDDSPPPTPPEEEGGSAH